MKVPGNVGEAISFPQTSDIVRREDTILPYIGSQLSFMAHILRMEFYFASSAAVSAATFALLRTSLILLSRLSPPVSSTTLASRNGVVSLP